MLLDNGCKKDGLGDNVERPGDVEKHLDFLFILLIMPHEGEFEETDLEHENTELGRRIDWGILVVDDEVARKNMISNEEN